MARPMTMAEKILAAHAGLDEVVPGQLIECDLDLVLANDITAPIAIQEFKKIGVDSVFDPTKIALVPDHYTPNKDIKSAEQAKTVRDFAREQGITHYYEVGCMGVEHALLPEQGVVGAGDLIIGADSHTCTYGALGAFSTGVGSTDAGVGLATGKAWFKVPESILFNIEGTLNPGVTGKDIILHIIGLIGVDGALYQAMEFRGSAIESLSMDERLTSRFNAGMLCLVAEPSYEMKYKILQRYYENTIAAAPVSGDDSLLAAYGGDGGHLTDEHFKHMAEVSGTNIRELESFCERCAGEAGDREREGSELSFDDIDAIASQYFDTSAKKINVQTVQSVIEEQYGVTHEELIGPRRNANIAKARHIAIYLAIEMCEMTTTAVGAEFGNRNHSTVSTSYKKVQKMIQEDRTVTEDLKSLRDKITLRS